jgi:putative ABC transport system permease protein
MDKFHQKDSRLFQAMLNRHNTDRTETERATPALMAEALADEIPEVDYAVATTSGMEAPHYDRALFDVLY